MCCPTPPMNSKTELLIIKSERNRNVSFLALHAVAGHNDTRVANGEFGPVFFGQGIYAEESLAAVGGEHVGQRYDKVRRNNRGIGPVKENSSQDCMSSLNGEDTGRG